MSWQRWGCLGVVALVGSSAGAQAPMTDGGAAPAPDLILQDDRGPIALPPPTYPAPRPIPPGPSGPESPGAPARRSPQDLYREGFSLMTQQRWTEAAALFDELVTAYPESPEAPVATEMARLARDSGAGPHLQLRNPALGESRLDDGGRVELLITSSLLGLWSGAALGIAANWGAPGSAVASGLAGLAGLGVGILTLSQHSISEGGASLISTGLIFGTLDGGLLDIMLAPTDTPTQIGLIWLGSAAGVLTAVFIQAAVPLSPGQASLIGGGGFLAAALAGLTLAGDPGSGISGNTVAGVLLLSTALGLGGGAVASHWFHPTRGRVVLTELAGLIGGVLVGGGAALLGDTGSTTISVGAGLGMLVGAGAVLLATPSLVESAEQTVARALPGVELLPPAPTLVPSPAGRPTAGLQLLAGSF